MISSPKGIAGIYAIQCTANGKRYIGSSNDILYRYRNHVARLKFCSHANKLLQADWILHGSDGFVFIVLEGISDQQQRLSEEEELIKQQHVAGNLYNILKYKTPKVPKGSRLRVASFGIYQMNKDWLIAKAAAERRSASWYLNELLTKLRENDGK